MNLKGTKPGANTMDDSNPLDRSTLIVELVDEFLSEFFIEEDMFSKASE